MPSLPPFCSPRRLSSWASPLYPPSVSFPLSDLCRMTPDLDHTIVTNYALVLMFSSSGGPKQVASAQWGTQSAKRTNIVEGSHLHAAHQTMGSLPKPGDGSSSIRLVSTHEQPRRSCRHCLLVTPQVISGRGQTELWREHTLCKRVKRTLLSPPATHIATSQAPGRTLLSR